MLSHTCRRTFVRNACLTAGLAISRGAALAQLNRSDETSLKVGTDPTGSQVPVDFVGLSYENMQLEDAAFFSPANRSLVEQFGAISNRGVLRLGGNTSEFGWWNANSTDLVPKRVDSPWRAAGEPVAATVFAITPQAIDNLDGFLQATGWKCIYGLNLGYGTPATDLPEAQYVYRRLGPRLEYFQVGNEVDLFKGHLRDPKTWDVGAYLDQWLVIARAVQHVLPEARFGLPDVAADVNWLPRIAERWQSVSDRPNVVSMSHHYYWNGPPSNPDANITKLLQPSSTVVRDAEVARGAAHRLGANVTYRMTEGNTVYRGGKYGVSDVFAAALWSADYLLQLMSLGYAGVNLHGGSGHAQAVSVGGIFHGEALMKDSTAPHPKPFYTPIANEGTLAGAGVDGKLNGTYLLEPVAYGMKFAARFAGCTMLPLSFDPGVVNATAYAAKRADGKRQIAIINKDATQALQITGVSGHIVQELTAPALDSREATIRQTPVSKNDSGRLTVPPATAVLAEFS